MMNFDSSRTAEVLHSYGKDTRQAKISAMAAALGLLQIQQLRMGVSLHEDYPILQRTFSVAMGLVQQSLQDEGEKKLFESTYEVLMRDMNDLVEAAKQRRNGN